MVETRQAQRSAPVVADEASWLEIDAAALRHNLELFRGVARGDEGAPALGAVLKGNAYGHGFAEVLPLVHPLVDCLYVITAQDALLVREHEARAGEGRREVVVLGAVSPREAAALAEAGIALVIGDRSLLALADALRQASAPPLDVHVHVDTGLSREGFLVEDLPEVGALLARCADVLRPTGVLSHFANVEDVTEQDYALSQVRRFEEALASLEASLPRGTRLRRHMAASAASLVLPSSRFDTLRVGISLYGLWPSPSTRLSARVVLGETPTLRPALSWRCRSQVVRSLPAGSFVGYGCTFRCSEPTRVAVLPVGYFDGYPRLLSGKGHVLVGGQRCPVLGRVMMNHVIVDVMRAARDGEDQVVATLLGSDGEETLSADTLAGWADTISYEIVARLGAHLKRIVVDRER